jgi:hypothetical protein
MSDLRAGAIRALGQRLFEIDGRRQLTNAYAQRLASESFDALLDYLNAYADEWTTEAEQEQVVTNDRWTTCLIAALRGEGTDT